MVEETNTNQTLSQEADVPKKRWYVVHAYSGQEAYVMNALKKRIEQEGVADQFAEIIVPKEQVVEMKGGQKRTTERKYFPGYVLVQMVMNDQTWHLVRSVPKVLGFIGGTSDRPTPISSKDVDRILNRLQQDEDKPKPKTIYEVGEVVRIIEGPFTDFDGVVEEANYEKSTLRVAVLIFGRSTPVEFQFKQVEKIN